MKISYFEDWFIELKRLAVSDYGFQTSEDFDESTWKGYWIDGYSPDEALIEDFSNL